MLICNLVPSDARILSDLRLGVEVASSHHNGRFAHLVSQTYISLKNKRLSNSYTVNTFSNRLHLDCNLKIN